MVFFNNGIMLIYDRMYIVFCLISMCYGIYFDGIFGYLYKMLLNFNFIDFCSEVYMYLYRICFVMFEFCW